MSYEHFKKEVWEKKLVESLDRAGKLQFPADAYAEMKAERNIYSIINDLHSMVSDVNINEIASHFDNDRLMSWCGAWGRRAKELLSELEEAVDELQEEY